MDARWSARQIGTIIAIGAAFVAVSLLAHTYKSALASVVGLGGLWGMVAFVVLTMCFEIFLIPLDLVLLVPLGAVIFGPVPTALLSITGWTVGASVSFTLARRYGLPLVSRLAGKDRVTRLRQRVPTRNLFWSVILLRMLVPVDLLSYALGLFAPIPRWQYVIATAIGVAPFGFYFAYAGSLPVTYQLLALLGALVFVLAVLSRYRDGVHDGEHGSVV